MSKKKAVIVSSVVLALLLVVGGTMAWFTSNPEAIDNKFTAGTVKIRVNENGFKNLENVNPGDTHEKKVTIESLGSKQTYIRVQLTPKWENADGIISELKEKEPTSYDIGGDWIEGEEGWYYYKDIMKGGETTPLIEEVKFDGPKMGDKYQGATFTLTIKAEAVQASHEAYKDAWKITDLPKDVEAWKDPSNPPSQN